MLIKEISIVDTNNGRTLRSIPFHLGANFVVDMEESARHNKVGKTTFLKLIDVILGANDRARIYKDRDTNSINYKLKSFIENHRIAANMRLVQDLEVDSEVDVSLSVDLFPRGTQYINGEKYSANEYRRELNIILFGNEQNTPFFRDLIKSFVRVSVSGDDDSFLHNLTRASYAKYRSVYDYLFRIADPLLTKELENLSKEKNSLEDSIRRYKKLNGIEDIEEQRQIAAALRRDQEQLKRATDDIVDSRDYVQNRDQIAQIRLEYAALIERLNVLEYRIERNEGSLKIAQEEESRHVDVMLIDSFFKEVCSMLPELQKTFEELVDFNEKLNSNKTDYFNAIRNDLLSEKKELERQIRVFVEDNSRFMSLVSTDRIDEYELLLIKLSEVQQHIGQIEESIETLEKFDENLSIVNENIETYSRNIANEQMTTGMYQKRMESFNLYFTAFAERINGERPILVYLPDTNKFPLSITEIDGSSTGTRKSLIAAYDLAYQRFALENELNVPGFDVHDVLESVEGDSLKSIVQIANQSSSQYIFAVLKEKLDSSGFSDEEQKKYQILQLAEDDRLFERSEDNVG